MADIPVFQFQPESVNMGGARSSGQAPRLGIEGGGNQAAGAQLYANTDDLSRGSKFPEFLNAVFEPKLAAVRQQKFYAGFAAAAAGKSKNDIEDNHHWFSGVFGPTPYDLGADVFNTQKQVSDFNTEFTHNLPELRKQSSEQVQQFLVDAIQTKMTGDVFTDSMMSKSMMESMGPMLEMHTKAREAYQQEDLRVRQFSSAQSAMTAYQNAAVTLAKLGKDSPDQQNVATAQVALKRNMLTALQTNEYQTDESKKQLYRDTITWAADNDNWYALQALDEAGIKDIFDTDEQIKLATRVESAFTKSKSRWAGNPEMIEMIAKYQATAATGGKNGKEVVEMGNLINQRFKAETGSPWDFYDAEDQAGKASQAMVQRINAAEAEAREGRTEAKELLKEQAKIRNQAELGTAYLTGTLGNYNNIAGVSTEDRDIAAVTGHSALMAEGRIPEAVGALVYNFSSRDGYKGAAIKEQINHALELSAKDSISKGFLEQYTLWNTMRESKGWRINPQTKVAEKTGAGDGEATARYYFGDYYDEMMNFHLRVTRDKQDPEMAYRAAVGEVLQRGDLRGENRDVSEKNIKAFNAAKSALNPGAWDRVIVGKSKLNRSADALLSTLASRHFEKMTPELGAENRAENSVRSAINVDGFDYAGQFAWQNPGDLSPLHTYLPNQNRESAAPVIEQAIATALKASGVDVSDDDTDYVIYRLPDDKAGKPHLAVFAYTPGRETKVAQVRDADIQAAFKAKVTKETTFDPKANIPPGFYRDTNGQLRSKNR